MPKFKVFFETVASTAIEVDAESFDEALEGAYQEGMPSLCAQCSGWGGRPGVDLSGDWEPDEKYYVKDGEFVEVERGGR